MLATAADGDRGIFYMACLGVDNLGTPAPMDERQAAELAHEALVRAAGALRAQLGPATEGNGEPPGSVRSDAPTPSACPRSPRPTMRYGGFCLRGSLPLTERMRDTYSTIGLRYQINFTQIIGSIQDFPQFRRLIAGKNYPR